MFLSLINFLLLNIWNTLSMTRQIECLVRPWCSEAKPCLDGQRPRQHVEHTGMGWSTRVLPTWPLRALLRDDCLVSFCGMWGLFIVLKPFSNARLLYQGKDAFTRMKKEITAANKLMNDDSHPQLLCSLMQYCFKIDLLVEVKNIFCALKPWPSPKEKSAQVLPGDSQQPPRPDWACHRMERTFSYVLLY